MCLPRSTAPSKLKGVGGVGVPGSWYETILRTSKNEEVWFGMDDCLGRTVRVLVAFYYLAITHPLSFFRFLVRYNMLWEGAVSGLLITVLFYPIYPFAAFLLLMAKQALLPPRAYEANNVFFDPPKGAAAAAVWSLYKALSPPVAQFMLNRGAPPVPICTHACHHMRPSLPSYAPRLWPYPPAIEQATPTPSLTRGGTTSRTRTSGVRTCAEPVRSSPRSWLGLGSAHLSPSPNPNPNPNPNPRPNPNPNPNSSPNPSPNPSPNLNQARVCPRS